MRSRHGFTGLLALLLCTVMITALFCTSSVYAADISVQNGTGTREPVKIIKSFGYRAKLNAAFTGFGFSMPTWTRTDSACTIYIYKWAGKLDKTLEGEPIASERFDPMKDGNLNMVEFDEQPAGEYLFYVAEPRGEVGVWTNTSPSDSKGFLYQDGVEGRGEPELKIRFSERVEEPFGNCEPSERPSYLVSPYGATVSDGVVDITESVGIRLNVAAEVSGFQFKLATYHASDMTARYSVFAWLGNYADTIASEPKATGEITLADNAYQGITFDPIAKGDYLFLVHGSNSTPATYKFSSAEGFKGEIYQNGFPLESDTQYFPEMKVIFSEELSGGGYFLDCEKSEGAVDGEHTVPEKYVIPSDSLIYTHPVMPDTWVFTDGLGRVSLTNKDVGGPKDDKTLAMFYWTWHVDGFVTKVPVNLQEYSEKYPDAIRDYDHEVWEGTSSYFWNEPIYGYYRATDQWVLRKQAELLTNAGVDVVFTDNTNGLSTWRNGYTALYESWSDAMNDGLKTPKLSYMFHFNACNESKQQIQSIYLDVYRQNKYPELWFWWDGKPMLLADNSNIVASASDMEKELSGFFTFRDNYPGYINNEPEFGHWGWLSTYPQAIYYASSADKRSDKPEQITVGIAMNHDAELHELAAMSGNNIMGRSYTSSGYHTEENAKLYGYNFAEQFNYALDVDPKVIFVTGWNEWRVGRYEMWPENSPAGVENAFPDQFNDEYSRDIEPSKGDLKDHYYYQLVNFVRQYKGVSPIPAPSGAKSIDLALGQEQWKTVKPYYAAYIGNTDDRDAKGYGDLVYTETSGRNDIIGAQIARDSEYLYFNVECAEDITPYTDALWMTLYIDSDQSNQGWESFDYVINKSAASESTAVLERFTGDGYNSEKVADCEYKVDGRYLTVKVKKSDLGLTGNDYTVNFAWTDNVHGEGDYTKFSGDILDFYISGDVAPGARFKYSYISTEENSSAEYDPDETDEAGETNAPDDIGKKSPGALPFIIGGAAAAAAIAAAAIVIAKKKKK